MMAVQWLQAYLHAVGRPHAARQDWHRIQGGSQRSIYLQVEKDPDDLLLVMQGQTMAQENTPTSIIFKS